MIRIHKNCNPSTVAGSVFVASVVLLAALSTPPAAALGAHEEQVRGQVADIVKAQVDGLAYGFVLTIERAVEGMPHSELKVAPTDNSSDWKTFVLYGAPGAMAAGDVTGDGSDELAIVHSLEGQPCPFPHTDQMPCGIIRVYDGHALVRGELVAIAEVAIRPVADGCPPSNHAPASLHLHDFTGDGRADLALGQVGLVAGSCGLVQVIPGHSLQGAVTMDAACSKVRGPVVQDQQPDQFGIHLELFTHEGEGYLAVGAPYAHTDRTPFAGRLVLYGLNDACLTDAPGEKAPTLLAEQRGIESGQLVGADTAYADGVLWVASKGLLQGLLVPSLDEGLNHSLPRSFPLSTAGDINGDGRQELLAGPWVITTEGEVLLDLEPFAAETFRGAILGTDHTLSSDRFGMRLWSLTDLGDPHLTIYPQPQALTVGQTVRVSIAEMVSLVPDPWPLQWQVTGGTVVEHGDTWILIKAQEPGTIIVQASLLETTETIQIPVYVRENQVWIDGIDAVEIGQPLGWRVHAPSGSTFSWSTPQGEPGHGTGARINSTYSSFGVHTVVVNVKLANESIITLERDVTVVKDRIEIEAPISIQQGQKLEMFVQESNRLTYDWHLSGAGIGGFNITGPSISIPVAGYGTVHVTVVAYDGAGAPVSVGHAPVLVENLPPVIRTFKATSDPHTNGLEATVAVTDPGGDPIEVEWSLDGRPVATGLRLNMPDLPPGQVMVTARATDSGGLSAVLSKPVQIMDSWVNDGDPDYDSPTPDQGQALNGQEPVGNINDNQSPGPFSVVIIALIAAYFIRLRRT